MAGILPVTTLAPEGSAMTVFCPYCERQLGAAIKIKGTVTMTATRTCQTDSFPCRVDLEDANHRYIGERKTKWTITMRPCGLPADTAIGRIATWTCSIEEAV